LWMPWERRKFLINDSRTNGYQDIYGNGRIGSILPTLQNQPQLY